MKFQYKGGTWKLVIIRFELSTIRYLGVKFKLHRLRLDLRPFQMFIVFNVMLVCVLATAALVVIET